MMLITFSLVLTGDFRETNLSDTFMNTSFYLRTFG